MTKGQKRRIIAISLALGYVAYSHMRISDLQSLNNLVYDAQACCEKGKTQKDVRSCFESYRYHPYSFDANTDSVSPDQLFDELSFRRAYLLIDYDSKKTVKSWELRAAYAAL
jgi:hypothetical protein